MRRGRAAALWPALAAGVLVALGGLGAMALVPPSTPDAAFRSRVQALRAIPNPTRPPNP